METKSEIKKVSFFEEDFLTARDCDVFKNAVTSALYPATKKNDNADKLKNFLIEKSGETKAFLFNSVEESCFWLFKNIKENESDKNEIIFLSKSLYDYACSEFGISQNAKYVFANHLGNFIAALSAKTRAVVLEFTDDVGKEIYTKDFVSQIAEICAVRDVYFIADERKTFPSATGAAFAFLKYGVLPDAVIIGGIINRSFALGGVLTSKRLKFSAVKKEVGFAVCAGALAAYEYAVSQAEKIAAFSKTLYETLNICKTVKSAYMTGRLGYAEVADGKKSASELKDLGLKAGVNENKLLFDLPLFLKEDEFAFGIDAIKTALKGAQNPFDMGKTY